MRNYFTRAYTSTSLNTLIVNVLVFLAIPIAYGFFKSLVTGIIHIGIIGMLFGAIGWLIELYCGISILLALLVFFGILK
ncbi:MAG: hypothetical protein PHG02_03155 [Oscillospiraceae bacterium]|nr:hypothetical protein [Oscillospiraceae bacterium]